ncbi:MAG: Nif3-like dinuclear metal center hexameric protein [Phycisphaerales bacterium]
MRLEGILTALQALAPHHLAEPWDQVGLHVGDPGARIDRALLCIDLTESVLEEAITHKAQLIVAYHPPIFKPLARLTTADPKQRIILRAARKCIAIYSPHTALDAAEGGVNDWLASGLGAGEIRTIKPSDTANKGFKLVTFVPTEAADKVRSAMCLAGAGRIGDYEGCSFSGPGEGTFRGGDTTSPAVGKAGRFERVPELRLELPVPADRLAEVVTALREAHPYEEPAFDIYPLQSPPDVETRTGQGRVLTLDKPVSLTTLVNRTKGHLGVKVLDVAAAKGNTRIERVGLCAGAGGSLLADAHPEGAIDAFLTGEMRHHDVLDAVSRGVSVVLAGHTQTERPYLPIYRRRLVELTGLTVKWRVSKTDRPPVQLR